MMYSHKIDHPLNFSFIKNGEEGFDFIIRDLGSDLHRLEVRSRLWEDSFSQADLRQNQFRNDKSDSLLSLEEGGELRLTFRGIRAFKSRRTAGFGVCGKKWIFCFDPDPETLYYGMGEKNNGFEKSGIKTKFWNTDVWADFAAGDIENGTTDPMYLSVPYLLMKSKGYCLGILIDNPFPVFMNLGSKETVARQQDAEGERDFYFGSTGGKPIIYFILGKTMDEITCKLQKLCGTTPLPPLWALGHHQCRWGYESFRDLDDLKRKFRKYKIPNDGLWLDIGYMDGFRIFTFNGDHFSDPEKEIREIEKSGMHVVPILDPGVKLDPGYPVYDDGVKEDIFCKNREGRDYVGFVWPGASVFPDFSTEAGRRWWVEKVYEFAGTGISGVWLDMNDPATGSGVLDEMRFNRGQHAHETNHNQYALGMQMASREGLVKRNPHLRPFLLSRSGFIGTSRYSAVWTGDNCSNYHHLRQSIPMALNLSLSGIPFNGPDVPGFGGEASSELMRAWYKAAFLFPFLRNHCAGGKNQEPWAFEKKTREVVAHYISLRYKFLPYIYNLFIEQEETGRPVLRPLVYEFDNEGSSFLAKIDNQIMVGSSIMQAPLLYEGQTERVVVLPACTWFSPSDGWLKGDRKHTVRETEWSTPLFIREGAVIPMQTGERHSNENDLSDIELHLFVKRETDGTYNYTYRFDDGVSLEYRNGRRT
ncbi:MAG: hypothetical protein GXP33_13775, partial [Spirochaetes bacterium]|nr:hypothetical protein [Spirochaetota bacterium]